MRCTACGPGATLVELGPGDPTAAVVAAWLRPRVPAVDVVPAAATVLVDGLAPDAVTAALAELSAADPGHLSAAAGPEVRIEVRFDGPDLCEVAERVGVSSDELVGLVTAADLVVAFTGFAPGFGYLTGLPPLLHLPRRATPRARVPAGSLAIAGEYAGIYPTASPGGWHLLGTTDAVLWDVDRPEPALLVPGARVRVVAVAGP